jgi:hemoglobin/transferrin/lactoferrin receptor protein
MSTHFPTFTRRPLAVLVSLICLGQNPAHAQDAVAALKEVVVSASRNQQFTDDLPLTMDVLNAGKLEAQQVNDIRGVAKDMPNVSVKHAPARFSVTGRGNATGADGNAGFTIRGQGGNRVIMLVDGVRLPRSYLNGSNAFGRDTVSLALLKQVEIIRGPSSALYGSDGLAGLVNFITLEPADFLKTVEGKEKTLGGRAWLSYSGDDKGINTGATLAGRANAVAEWSVTATKGRADGLSNMGSNDAANLDRTTPNPQSITDTSLLGKLVLRPNSIQKHMVTIEHINKDNTVDLLSSRVKTPVAVPLNYATLSANAKTAAPAAAIVGESSSKTIDRNRLTWDARYQMTTSWADNLQTVLSWQESAAQDDGQTQLLTAWANDGIRVRKTSYQERTWQATVQADKTIPLSKQWVQKLTYGFDYSSTDISSFANGSDPLPLPAFTPKNYFPDTRDTAQAIYLQSELIHDSWSVTPGIRLNQYALDVTSQAGYYPGLSATPGKSLSGTAVSPKLGVLYRASPQWSVYGNYASGFRAPEGQQVNSALEASTAKLLPNPDLKPEESQNFEIGARARLNRLTLDMAAFSGRYTNLIQEKKDLGTANGLAASVANPTLFQTVNIDRANIHGFEVRGHWAWGTFASGRLSSPFSYGVTRGTNTTTGLPLAYIEPAKLLVGLRFESAAWDLGLNLIHHDEKQASDLDSVFIPKSTTLRQFLIPAATTLDLQGQWRLSKDVRFNWAITNLTDEKYWKWSDVQGLASNPAAPLNSVVDAYTQPGRHVNLSLVLDF